jgi:hypothetical protein
MSWTDSVASSGKDLLLSIEGGIGMVGRGIWEVFRELPILGALIGGGLGLGAAMTVGVGELAVTLIAAYIGYRMLAPSPWSSSIEGEGKSCAPAAYGKSVVY